MADIEDPTKKDKPTAKNEVGADRGNEIDISKVSVSTNASNLRGEQQSQLKGGVSTEEVESLLDKAATQSLSPEENALLLEYANHLIVRPGQDLDGANDYALGRIVEVLGNSSDEESKQAMTRMLAFAITNPAYADSAIKCLSVLGRRAPDQFEQLASIVVDRNLDPLIERTCLIASRVLPDKGRAFFDAHRSNKLVSRFVGETLARVA